MTSYPQENLTLALYRDVLGLFIVAFLSFRIFLFYVKLNLFVYPTRFSADGFLIIAHQEQQWRPPGDQSLQGCYNTSNSVPRGNVVVVSVFFAFACSRCTSRQSKYEIPLLGCFAKCI